MGKEIEVSKAEACKLSAEGKIEKDEFGIEKIYPCERRYIIVVK